MTNISNKIAMSMYLTLGGDPERVFNSVDEIYAEVDKLLNTNKPIGTIGLDFTQIGYSKEMSNEINDRYNADLEYSKSVANKFTPGMTTAHKLFYNDNNLVYAPFGDTSNVTNMYQMFGYCTSLVLVPLFDTSNVTSMGGMFGYCTSLQEVPLLDMSKNESITQMFYGCKNLKTIPQFNTSNVTNMSGTFNECVSLESIPLLDASKVTEISTFLGGISSLSLTDFGGLKNLGMQSSVSGTNYIGFDDTPNLTKESVLNILNNLYDRKTAGYSILTLKLHTNHLVLLSDEEKAIATNKGWTLA